jgi:crotonobetainyl-CoA:carnitine CoA-transferase CaiB-like acyl-CoA transferase
MDVGDPDRARTKMLGGLCVLDCSDPSGWLTGRILADFGADVALVEPPGGHPGRARRFAFASLNAGKRSVIAELKAAAGLERVREWVRDADVVIESGRPELAALRETAPGTGSVWCAITPFGITGPKASWRASDLGVVAQAGTMFMTGDPDRAPLHSTFPTSWYHGCAEAAAAICAALHWREISGTGQLVDVSLQEAHLMANMSRVAQFPLTSDAGSRAGALMRVGRTTQREIWPCADGFVSFGLRGGPARIPGLKRLVAWMTEEGAAPVALTERDWDSYSHTTLTQDEVDEISDAFARFFAAKTMTELYRAALERGLMLAPANTAGEILAGAQAAARDFFVELDDPDLGRIPLARRFVAVDGVPGATRPAPYAGEHDDAGPWDRPVRRVGRLRGGVRRRAFGGVHVLEFGAGAAGPLTTRYLADHGATVIRVESRSRPDFLRLYAITSSQRTLEASPMFAAFNCNKLAITLNLKHSEGRALALKLVEWADVVAENFAPGAMERFGLGYEDLVAVRPDLIMISTCLHGQTGPERDYPGFGGQGSALSGFNHLTGWPDREPLGPYGTITDSLAPRFAAAAVGAALVRRRRTVTMGARLDLSQVECAVYSLGETIVEHAVTGSAPGRLGNRSREAAPHGAFRCAGDDRWIAIAIWSDDEWSRLVEAMGSPARTNARFATAAGRLEHVDEVERHLEDWTRSQDRDGLAARLQSLGLEACPVADLEDCYHDPQLAHRGHFRPMDHPVLGRHDYETLGFRLSACPPEFTRPGPTLGRDNAEVYKGILGLPEEEFDRLAAAGAFD